MLLDNKQKVMYAIITGIGGLNTAQKSTLKTLSAIELIPKNKHAIA
jgi:hypothetical protein